MSDWRGRARCRGMTIDLFYPGRGGRGSGGRVQRAKAVCALCTVRTSCLVDALADPVREDLGIRGGLSEQERKALRRERAGRLAPVVTLPVPSVPQQQPGRAA